MDNRVKPVEMKVLEKGLTFEQAQQRLRDYGACITRPTWKGYHLRYFSDYVIRLANGKVIMNPKEVYSKEKTDWMVVEINDIVEVGHVVTEIKKTRR